MDGYWETVVEWIAITATILYLVGAYRGAAWSWLVVMPAPVAFGILFWHHKLYADVALMAFYFVTNIVGWVQWLRGGPQHDRLPITTLSWDQRALVLGAVIGTAGASALGLARFTDASYPWWDSLNTTLSVAAQLLLVRKKIDSWPLQIVACGISTGLMLSKDLPATAALSVGYLVMDCLIIRAWRRKMKNSDSEPTGAMLASA